MKNRKKKSYNPLKMWGSWIGAIIAFIWLNIAGMKYYNFFFTPYMNLFENMATSSVMIILTHIILGFLIGWWINMRFRR